MAYNKMTGPYKGGNLKTFKNAEKSINRFGLHIFIHCWFWAQIKNRLLWSSFHFISLFWSLHIAIG